MQFISKVTKYLRSQQVVPYTPTFDDKVFLKALAPHSAALEEAWRLRHSGITEYQNRVVQHFRQRSAPRFFVDPPVLWELAQRLNSSWKNRLIARLQADQEVGLPIYAGTYVPLTLDFPWDSLSSGPGKDDLYAVRPHRFSFAPCMALASLYDMPITAGFISILKDWMQCAASGKNRFPYLSNLVVIQRFLALSWAWAFLAARLEEQVEEGAALEFLILKILYADAQFLAPRLGRSYPNNHLLADGFAGWYISTLFPEFISLPNCQTDYERLWLREFRRQILEDGTSFEHSIHYHEFACEMAVAYVLLSQCNGFDIPKWTLERTEQMLALQMDLGGSEGTPLMIGDATEDPLFPLDTLQGWGTAAWREIYRVLFSPNVTSASLDNPAVERAFWLLGGNLAPPPTRQDNYNFFRSYPKGGFFIFSDSHPNTRLIFRTGPSAEQSICAGHMHADLLSIYLTLEGIPAIVEAGTYTYRFQPTVWPPGTPPWRAYFMGPQAHNTLAVDGKDPLGPVGDDFRSKDIAVRVITTQHLAAPTLAAWVEGIVKNIPTYEGYCRGVVHICSEYWLVYDLLPSSIPLGCASFGFQLAPGTQIMTIADTEIHAEIEGQKLRLSGSDGLSTPEIINGRINPPSGWVSPRYGEKLPAPQVRFSPVGASGLTAFLLQSIRHEESTLCHIEVSDDRENGLAFQIKVDTFVDYLILRPPTANGIIKAWGIRFDGMLLWLRMADGKLIQVRWLEGRSVSSERFGIEIHLHNITETFKLVTTPAGFEVSECPLDRLSMVSLPSL